MEKIERVYARDHRLSGNFKDIQFEKYCRDWLEPMRRKVNESTKLDDYVNPRVKSRLDGYLG
ncbi:hypothetical protein PsalN5692_01798 [Piscirickettsia salmonis]|uniref:hypothetical protein n=1 Tax=Piscirickettsia salmonis TaxID=1238 RepID=UPI0012BA3126|nr:hypothetical protein [Piscirickettsia salmonis]QGP50334.1 hypothetical protein PsalN5692_01798 [Piscirickettsia salmonis]QGP54843.1 hypothetical protein PsalSR1_02284 [Piscirickettsia salmonis]QGP59265.1 hypothetical protein PsalBI1_01852 [Piscirickettsia salmonis]QGP63967.1 hypothetical protein PsalMR5_01831 [Piscirickettsia salmonis]